MVGAVIKGGLGEGAVHMADKILLLGIQAKLSRVGISVEILGRESNENSSTCLLRKCPTDITGLITDRLLPAQIAEIII